MQTTGILPANESARVYFSAADRQLENFLPPETFERSLTLNILFQPGILVPDIFLFISEGLERHISKYDAGPSLFEACVAHNVIVPAFRDKTVKTFHDALHSVRSIQGIRENATLIASRLQFAADKNPSFSPAFWPTHDVGEKFDNVIEQYLMRSELPDVGEEAGIDRRQLQGIWSLTKKWRINCIEEARERTRQVAGRGLRRVEIMNAVGRSLGLPKDHAVHDVAELIALPQSHWEKEAIKLFCRWMTECYQYNQAREFRCTPSFPAFNAIDSLIPISILPVGSSSPAKLTSAQTIRIQVPHPPLKVLLEIPPTELFKIREDLGYQYFWALHNWQHEPTEAKAQEVKEALEKYAQKILDLSLKDKDFSAHVLDVVLANAPRNRQLLSSSLNFIKELPGVGTIIVFLEELVAIHQVYRRPETSELELHAPQSVTKALPDVNLQEPSVGATKSHEETKPS